MWHDAYANAYQCGDCEDFDPGFIQDSMINQLNKVIDAGEIVPGVDLPEKKYKPFNVLTTDEGDEFVVTIDEAKMIRDLVLGVPVKDRLDVLKQIQSTKGLTSVLEYVKMKLK